MASAFILPVDKPAGPTSHDIVAMARRALQERRIGHTGTLDPFASGLLLLCVGQATRLAEYFGDLRKSYSATARFDGRSPTDDATGAIAISDAATRLTAAAVRAALRSQVGSIAQLPSAYSAKKIAGERAYDIARRGELPDLAPVPVTIYDIRITAIELPIVHFEVDCASGTYVRAIARDAGATLGTGGYLTALRRTAIGPYDVAAAVSVDQLIDTECVQRAAVTMRDALKHMNAVIVDEAEEQAIRFGQTIEHAGTEGTVALVRDGELIAIASCDGARIKPKKVFPRD